MFGTEEKEEQSKFIAGLPGEKSRDKLDYASLVFLQMNRISFQLSNLKANSFSQGMHYVDEANQENFRGAVFALECLLIPKLPKEYWEDKKKIDGNLARGTYTLLMRYLPNTGILSTKRVGLTSGVD